MLVVGGARCGVFLLRSSINNDRIISGMLTFLYSVFVQ